jgi:threonylcarbamoyladenosine tRNA methylthiotransferase MtaB
MPALVRTFGCRLNIAESEEIARLTRESGLEDAVVINTCAVTSEASKQARQAIRRLKRERPDVAIIVTGCGAQVEAERYAAMPQVARVIGNHEKMLGSTWTALAGSNSLHGQRLGLGLDPSDKIEVADIMGLRETALHLVEGFGAHTRGFVQVQNGCDHRCTFCIIPFGRGPSRSVPMGAVVDHVRRLVAGGTREVVLTGVDMTSYGKDLPGSPMLGALVGAILRHVPELERLRLSSIDAVEVDDGLRDLIASETRLMPHLHLSLQSGDDLILKRMKRRHTRDGAIRFCTDIRALRPDIVLGADLIAGFPTEDEEMFARSEEIIEACGLTHVHVFPFSPRPGTPAARMPQLPLEVIRARAARLRATGSQALARHLDAQTGLTCRVLTERGNVARTEGFTLVKLGQPVEAGRMIDVVITGHDGARLIAA